MWKKILWKNRLLILLRYIPSILVEKEMTVVEITSIRQRVSSLGPAHALGQSSSFKKYERKNLEFFTWSLNEKIGFFVFKKKTSYYDPDYYGLRYLDLKQNIVFKWSFFFMTVQERMRTKRGDVKIKMWKYSLG